MYAIQEECEGTVGMVEQGEGSDRSERGVTLGQLSRSNRALPT